MTADRRELVQRARALAQGLADGRLNVNAVEHLAHAMERSELRRSRRADARPRITFPDDLPIVQRRADIVDAIVNHQVSVICGETGSGKSTQLPKLCLDLGRGVAGLIGHTQPRRIAARGVATRVSDELDTPLGDAVGYKVRFGDKTSEGTYIKLMTDGVLLAETQSDPLLERYDTLIIDEAHERSLNIDFLLGYLRQVLPKRPDLKVIVTSATIDPQRLSEHFGGPKHCPVVEVSGRTYPVDVQYRPFDADGEDEREFTMEERVVSACGELAAQGPGDILVFLPGEREIRETTELLTESGWGRHGTEVVQLFARLSAEEQMRVFSAHRGTRIVLSTNVAETSLTVPGIRYVVDSGLARISRYSPRTKVQRLPIEAISRASANQRAGRCGRIGPGVCVRLYSQEDFESRALFTEPEIKRTNLASVILQMKALRLGEPESFPFVEPPDDRMIADGYDTLAELGAIGEKRELTPVGRMMSRLPLDPRVGRMLLAGRELNCLREVLIIASALSVQDPRERPSGVPGAAQRADEAHAIHRHESSDFLSFLNLWTFFHEQSAKLSGSRLRKMCSTNYLSFVRMREWQEVHRQIGEMLESLREHEPRHNAKGATSGVPARAGRSRDAQHAAKPVPWEDRVHMALLTGLLSNVGSKGDTHEYNGARGNAFSIFPGSAVFSSKPKWVMSAELVRTTKLYARCNAAIRPEWIEAAAGHLVKRTYSDPQYDDRTGRVMAFERVTLFGLEIVAKRRVHYGPIRPEQAREVFIHHALVEGLWESKGRFVRHNAELIERVRRTAAKLRRSDIIADTTGRFAFFDARLPRDVYAGEAFERWRIGAERDQPRLLFMSESDLLPEGLIALAEAQFPDELEMGGGRLRLDYHSDAAAADDGVTLVVPVELLPSIDADRCEWLVPGLLADKLEGIIRELPKSLRTAFVPAPAAAERAAREIEPFRNAGIPFGVAASRTLSDVGGVNVRPEDVRLADLPQHLRMNFRVVDADGQALASGRALDRLRVELSARVAKALAGLPEQHFNRASVTSWDFGTLPETADVRHSGVKLHVFPALVDEGERVALRPLPSELAARDAHLRGCCRLASLYVRDELLRALRYPADLDQLGVLFAPIGTKTQLRLSLTELIAQRVFFADGRSVRSREQFEARIAAGLPHLESVAQQAAMVAGGVLRARQSAASAVAVLRHASLRPTRADIEHQIAQLTPPEFLATTPIEWLVELPRYFQAMVTRAQRAAPGGDAAERDATNMGQVTPWEDVLRELDARPLEELPRNRAEAERFRWMLQEYRVSLFAQELGTKMPVSPKRLEKQWQQVFVVA